VRSVYAGREDDAGPAARAILERAGTDNSLQQEDEIAAWILRDELRVQLLHWMETTPLIVAPVGAVAAFRHDVRKLDVEGQRVSIFRAFSYAQAGNVFDLPAVAVPVGRTRANLPIGVQIIGRPLAEQTVLAAARIIEEIVGGWQRPPEILSMQDDFPL
jgi:amidase